MTRIAREPNPIELSDTQIDNYRVRPENFKVRNYNDPMPEPFHGQGKNDSEAQKRSMERCNSGSVRAEGNVNHAGRPHVKVTKEYD